jgi:hypothetical protein
LSPEADRAIKEDILRAAVEAAKEVDEEGDAEA